MRECIYINYLEFFPSGDLSLLPHLFIYAIISLYQYGLMDIYFICLFWVIVACYIIYWVAHFFFFFSFGQWELIQVGSCIPLICSSFCFFVLFLIFWYYIRCSGLIFPAPALELTISPRSFHSFYRVVVLKIKTGCWVFLRSFESSDWPLFVLRKSSLFCISSLTSPIYHSGLSST